MSPAKRRVRTVQGRKPARAARRRRPEEREEQVVDGDASARLTSSLGNAELQRLARSGAVPANVARVPVSAGWIQRMVQRAGDDDEDFDLPETPLPHVLRRGHENWGVAVIQAGLNEFLPDDLPELEIDRIFGPRTETAVRLLQWAQELEIDGKVGPDTLDAIDEKGIDFGAAVEVAREAGMLY